MVMLSQSEEYQAEQPYQQRRTANPDLAFKWALKDELTYQLSSAKMNLKTFEIIDKYHEQAKSVLYRINLYDFSAIEIASAESKGIFVINTSDLSPTLYHELEQLKRSDPKGFDEVVTEAVQTILEGINKRYYHIAGLWYKVTWRFEP